MASMGRAVNARHPTFGRRGFLGAIGAALLSRRQRRRIAPIRIGWLGKTDSVPTGVGFGLSEAHHAAGLLRQPVELVGPGPSGPTSAAGGWLACLALTDLREAVRQAERTGVIVLNLDSRDSALRRECHPALFHVEAADEVYAAAREGGRCARPVLWHGGLVRYGAAQLNDRFRQYAGRPMGASDWAGWFGVKLLWESGIRAGAAGPAALRRHLTGTDAAFDGHKGQPLLFHRDSRQLIQPLFCPDSPEPIDWPIAEGTPSCS